MRNFATYIVAKPGVAPGTMLKPGYCRASFIIGIALAYGHKKKPQKWGFRVQICVRVLQILDFQGLLRRERDSNPRYLSVR